MQISSITIKNFRNIKKLSLDFASGLNVIVAPNGTGKTNVLEGISLASRGKSPRTNQDLDLIPFEVQEKPKKERFLHIKAVSPELAHPKEFTAELSSTEADAQEVILRIKKSYIAQGKRTTRKIFQELLPSVYFSPESIGYLTQGHGKMRDLFDSIIEISDFEYRDFLSEYKKSLRNRNILLKKLQNGGNKKELSYWTKTNIRTGSHLIKKRWEIQQSYNKALQEISQKVFKTQVLTLDYLPHIQTTPLDEVEEIAESFVEKVQNNLEREILAGKTLKGPHRDRWILNLDEKDLSRFGSRGQQRLGVFSVFLAFYDHMKSQTSTTPLLLLDDITSELDSEHIKLLKKTLIKSSSQVFLTTTNDEIASSLVNKVSESDSDIDRNRKGKVVHLKA